jgi:hypothetical protein
MNWAFRPRAIEGELLSSFLARAAHAHGETAGAFCRRHLPDSWFFTRDIDRGVATRHHRRIAELSGMSMDEVGAMTLRPLVGLFDANNGKDGAARAVTPWVSAVGLKQARRRHCALSYCVECLSDGGFARQCWRLSFHTWCPHHARPLMDMCLRCSAAFVPHLTRRSLRHCHDCGEMLRASAARPTWAHAIELQARMDAWLASALRGCVESRERLAALRVLVSIGLHARHARPDYAPLPACPGLPGTARLELLHIMPRVAVMAWLAKLVNDWPVSFRVLAEGTGLTQLSFRRTGVTGMASGWLREQVEQLPEGHPRHCGRATEVFTAQLVQTRGEAGANWRAKRAELLMVRVSRRGN